MPNKHLQCQNCALLTNKFGNSQIFTYTHFFLLWIGIRKCQYLKCQICKWSKLSNYETVECSVLWNYHVIWLSNLQTVKCAHLKKLEMTDVESWKCKRTLKSWNFICPSCQKVTCKMVMLSNAQLVVVIDNMSKLSNTQIFK